MHKEPLISVIVYIHKNYECLEKCLKTLTLQTYNNLEIICINNGCNEEVSSILNEFKKNDERIIVHNLEHTDISTARNEGIKLATGDYISFINGCDWVTLDLYQVFMNKISITDAEIYMFNASFFSNKFVDIPDFEFFDQDEIFNNEDNVIHTYGDIKGILIKNNMVINKIYKKSFLENNNIRFFDGHNFSDYLFNLQTLLSAKQIIINDEAYYRYVENNMIECANSTDIFDIFDITDEMLKTLQIKALFEYYQTEFFNFTCNVLNSYFKMCKNELKREYFEKMRIHLTTYFYSMEPEAQNFVMGIREVNIMLNSTFDEFNETLEQ